MKYTSNDIQNILTSKTAIKGLEYITPVYHEAKTALWIMEAMGIQKDIVIPTTGWIEIAEGEEGGVSIDVVQKDITDKMIPFVSIVRNDMKTASDCGMSTTTETINGAIKFYAERIPEKEINASIVLLKASAGSDFYINTIATDREIKEMLNEVFHKEIENNGEIEENKDI